MDNQLSTINVSSLVVASYLQLAELESQSREVQVRSSTAPCWTVSSAAMTGCWLLQALVAENAAASQRLSRLEEQLSAVNFSLGVLLQQVSQRLIHPPLFLNLEQKGPF